MSRVRLCGLLALMAVLCANPGCSALGMATGAAYGHEHGPAVPVESLDPAHGPQFVRLELADGRIVSGSLLASDDPDSVALGCSPSRTDRSAFSDAVERRAFARDAIVRCQVTNGTYRYAGLVLGACVDAYFLAAIAHPLLEPYRPHRSEKVGAGR